MDSAKGVAVTKLWRDSSLAGDKVSKVDVIKDCLLRAEKEFGKAYDMVVDLDITSPLRTVEDIKMQSTERLQEMMFVLSFLLLILEEIHISIW